MNGFLKKYKHYIIGPVLALLILFFAPASNGLTEIGVKVLAVFVLTCYWWVFIAVDWTSMLLIPLFAMTGVLTVSQIVQSSFGTWLWPCMLASAIVNGIITETGLFRRLVNWFISRKVIENRPYMFIFLYYLVVYLIALVLDVVVASIIMLPIAKSIVEELEYEKGDKFPAILYAGTMWLILAGFAATPVGHSVPLIVIGLMEATFNISVSVFSYSVVGIPTTFLIFLFTFLITKYIVRPDMSKFKNYNIEEKRSKEKMSKEEKFGLVVFIFVYSLFFIPDMISGFAPNVSAFISSLSKASPPILGCALFMIIRVNGKPMGSFTGSLQKVQWSGYILTMGIYMMSAAMSAPNTGISEWLCNIFAPMISGMTSWFLFALLVAAAVLIMTNFISCTVVANLGFMVAIPLALMISQYVNPIAVAIVIAIVSNMGVLTPGASFPAAYWLGTDYLNPGRGFKYGLYIIIPTILAGVLAYPLSLLVF